uniref:CCHC-type domain-containing protein n=1 Tax=Naja naja TaxID=35670 RepID=A0A8C6XFQ8_NAJNA
MSKLGKYRLEELNLRGEPISERSLISIIINSLDASWDNFIPQLDNSNYDGVSLEIMTGKLIAEYNLRKDRAAFHKDRGIARKPESPNKVNVIGECYNCGSRGHFRRDCPRFIGPRTDQRGHSNYRNRWRSPTPKGRSQWNTANMRRGRRGYEIKRRDSFNSTSNFTSVAQTTSSRAGKRGHSNRNKRRSPTPLGRPQEDPTNIKRGRRGKGNNTGGNFTSMTEVSYPRPTEKQASSYGCLTVVPADIWQATRSYLLI